MGPMGLFDPLISESGRKNTHTHTHNSKEDKLIKRKN